VRCDACDASAVIDQPYGDRQLCSAHFLPTVTERVRREFHRQLPRFKRGTLAVALSGGKDSASALVLTRDYFQQRPGVSLVALTVDEGIHGYRSATIRKAEELTRSLGVPHRIVRAKATLGVTTDEAAARLVGTAPCSYCGVWRRQLLNRAAREAEADALVLGFNLDDLAQTVLMNLARADLTRLKRMAPHRSRQRGFVPRIAPLATIPEREVYLFARLTGVPFDHGECPYALAANRNVFREVLWRLEEEVPGTRHALLRSRERIVNALHPSADAAAPNACQVCGEPSKGPVCRACEYRGLARVGPLGETGT